MKGAIVRNINDTTVTILKLELLSLLLQVLEQGAI